MPCGKPTAHNLRPTGLLGSGYLRYTYAIGLSPDLSPSHAITMKATLEFTLPEEQTEHMDAVQGAAWRGALWNVDQQCRNWLKYGHELKSVEETLEYIRKMIREETEDLSQP